MTEGLKQKQKLIDSIIAELHAARESCDIQSLDIDRYMAAVNWSVKALQSIQIGE